eukprot:PhM_4_TR16137/c1_g2_i1/m.88180
MIPPAALTRCVYHRTLANVRAMYSLPIAIPSDCEVSFEPIFRSYEAQMHTMLRGHGTTSFMNVWGTNPKDKDELIDAIRRVFREPVVVPPSGTSMMDLPRSRTAGLNLSTPPTGLQLAFVGLKILNGIRPGMRFYVSWKLVSSRYNADAPAGLRLFHGMLLLEAVLRLKAEMPKKSKDADGNESSANNKKEQSATADPPADVLALYNSETLSHLKAIADAVPTSDMSSYEGRVGQLRAIYSYLNFKVVKSKNDNDENSEGKTNKKAFAGTAEGIEFVTSKTWVRPMISRAKPPVTPPDTVVSPYVAVAWICGVAALKGLDVIPVQQVRRTALRQDTIAHHYIVLRDRVSEEGGQDNDESPMALNVVTGEVVPLEKLIGDVEPRYIEDVLNKHQQHHHRGDHHAGQFPAMLDPHNAVLRYVITCLGECAQHEPELSPTTRKLDDSLACANGLL